PRQVDDRAVALAPGVREALADLLAEVVVEPEVGTAVLPRLDRLEVPLQQALRVRERSVLLDVTRGGQQEDLRSDLVGLQLAGLDLRAVVPEGRRLDLDEVADHEPVELREPESLSTAVRGPDRGVLADHEVALDLPLQHLLHR